MRLQLATKQVVKLFGPRPWLGRRLPQVNLQSTCGVEWYQKRIKTKYGEWIPVGEGYFRPHKVTVNPVVCLNPVEGKRDQWDFEQVVVVG